MSKLIDPLLQQRMHSGSDLFFCGKGYIFFLFNNPMEKQSILLFAHFLQSKPSLGKRMQF